MSGYPTVEQSLEPFFDAQGGVAKMESQFTYTNVGALITAQQLKSSPGLLRQITWGKNAVGTITIEDRNGGSGGQVIQVLTITAATVSPNFIPFNVKFANGLRITQSVDLGLTVIWR